MNKIKEIKLSLRRTRQHRCGTAAVPYIILKCFPDNILQSILGLLRLLQTFLFVVKIILIICAELE